MKQYFVRIDRWYYPKNNLETAIIEKVRSEFSNVLINESDLKNFEDDLRSAIVSLNQSFKRAKPLLFRGWRSNNHLYIRRDVPEGIDDLVILEAVAVSRVYNLEEVKDDTFIFKGLLRRKDFGRDTDYIFMLHEKWRT